MRTLLFILIVGLYVISCSSKEQNFLESKDAYFGLTPPGLTPEVFALGFASDTTWAEHCQVAVSPDGKEIYWSAWSTAHKTQDGTKNTEQIFYSRFKNGKWSKPALAEFTKNNPYGLNGGPAFSPDGKRLYFYQVKSPWASSDMNTYFVEKKNGEWGTTPINVGEPYNTSGQDYSPIFTKNGVAYKNLFGKIAKFTFSDNKFSFTDSIVIYKNYRQLWNFCISPNEDYVIFSDMRKDGYCDVDLYISFKTSDNTWGEPINMGDKINTSTRERFPMVSPDGKYLFFMRHTKTQDFFWVSTDIITELKKY